MADVFLLEDDRALANGIMIALRKDGHTVTPGFCEADARRLTAEKSFDLYLLDINLPDGSGLDFCQKLRAESGKPVFFLTAKDTEEDMLAGFAAGCDDYIAKPFSVAVLRRKVSAILRRSSGSRNENTLVLRGLTVDFERMAAYKNGVDCHLTATEYKLLEYMAKNRGRALTRTMLLEQIWDIDGSFIDENTLSVHIRRLRSKIEDDPKNPEHIITVFGIGYTFGNNSAER